MKQRSAGSLLEREGHGSPSGAFYAPLVAAAWSVCVFGLLVTVTHLWLPLERLLLFYPPSGALSGISTVTVIVFLLTLIFYRLLWRRRPPARLDVLLLSAILILIGLVTSFPPFYQLFG